MLSGPTTDAQGFVAVRRVGGDMDMAVVSFRGTENLRDWETNLRYSQTLVKSPHYAPNGLTGRVHQGFLDAFMPVRGRVDRYMPRAAGLPIYITGHSRGGALAILEAAHLSGWGLEACHTLGTPRVGDKEFAGSLQTPVYRVVNPLDAVPRVPARSQGYSHSGARGS